MSKCAAKSNLDATLEIPVAATWSVTQKELAKISHVWTIKNFSFFLNETFLESPPFSAGANDGIQWKLRLYPYGFNEESNGYIALFLILSSSSQCEVPAICVFSIKATEHGNLSMRHPLEPRTFKLTEQWGWRKFIRREELFTDPRGFLPGDKLTVCCEIAYATDSSNLHHQSSRNQSEVLGYNPSAFLRELYVSRKYFDVVLELNGKEFRAHKAILAVCSPVFKAMFDQDPDREKIAWIEISGMKEGTLTNLLRFIYTGEADVTDNMLNLLSTIHEHVRLRATPKKNSSRRN